MSLFAHSLIEFDGKAVTVWEIVNKNTLIFLIKILIVILTNRFLQ